MGLGSPITAAGLYPIQKGLTLRAQTPELHMRSTDLARQHHAQQRGAGAAPADDDSGVAVSDGT